MTFEKRKQGLFSVSADRAGLCVFVAACLFPFFWIALYNIPLADEFFGMFYRGHLSVWQHQQLLLETWSGRFTANFLETIYPKQLNYPYYKLVALSVILVFPLLFALISRKLLARRTLLFAGLFYLILINYIPSIGDLLYYTPAIIIYSAGFFFALLMVIIHLSALRASAKYILLLLLQLLLMGTTETSIPVIVFLTTANLFFCIQDKKPYRPELLNWIIVCSIAALLVSINGNRERLEVQSNPPDLEYCLRNYVFSLWYWTVRFLPALPFLAILAAWASRQHPVAQIQKQIQTRHILTGIIGYFLLYTPLLLINLSNYRRLGNVFYFYFIFLALFILIKIISRLEIPIKTPKIFLFLLILIFMTTGNIKAAYQDLRHDYTRTYTQALRSRYEILEKHRGDSIVHVPAIPKTDYILSIQDVNAKDDGFVPNQLDPFKAYYQIDSIIIQ